MQDCVIKFSRNETRARLKFFSTIQRSVVVRCASGRSGLSALDELDRIEEEKLKQAEEFEKRRQEELKEQARTAPDLGCSARVGKGGNQHWEANTSQCR